MPHSEAGMTRGPARVTWGGLYSLDELPLRIDLYRGHGFQRNCKEVPRIAALSGSRESSVGDHIRQVARDRGRSRTRDLCIVGAFRAFAQHPHQNPFLPLIYSKA